MKEDVLVDFTLGDMVTVISGAWKDTVGAIKAINESKQTITINVEMFGRETPVELGFAEVKKIVKWISFCAAEAGGRDIPDNTT